MGRKNRSTTVAQGRKRKKQATPNGNVEQFVTASRAFNKSVRVARPPMKVGESVDSYRNRLRKLQVTQ